MSNYIKIISNVKIIRRIKGSLLDIEEVSNRYDVFPFIDIINNKKGFHIFADIPDMMPEDVLVYIYGNKVIIEGEKKNKFKNTNYKLIHLERHFLKFRRVFTLPFQPKRYDASLNDGVLHILFKY